MQVITKSSQGKNEKQKSRFSIFSSQIYTLPKESSKIFFDSMALCVVFNLQMKRSILTKFNWENKNKTYKTVPTLWILWA